MIVPLNISILIFRSQETPIDGQPPALPPKLFKKNSWNQIHHSHSQQELDNHINETFDVPASPEKSTVSVLIHLNHSAFYQNDAPTLHELGSEAFQSCCVCALPCSITVPSLAPAGFTLAAGVVLCQLTTNHCIGMVLETFWALAFQHMQKFLPNLFFEKSFAINFKEDIAGV